MKIKFVYFDAGGTLVRTAEPVGITYSKVASHYGFQADADELTLSFARVWKQLMQRDPEANGISRVEDDRRWWKEVVRQTWEPFALPPHFPFDDYFMEVYEAYGRADLWRVYADVEDALQLASEKGIRIGVLSNWDRRLPGILEGLDLLHRFESVVISSEHGVEKPNRKIFDLAREKVGFTESEMGYLGDEERADGQGARGAGWRCEIVRRPEFDLLAALEKLLTESLN
ncbi:MAG: HAD-IA family hydrolase [Verrucomicrobiota bacterium]